jgi:pimeloyl-ACP methyl ester carboxylesterase
MTQPVPPLTQLLLEYNESATFGTIETYTTQLHYSEWGNGRPLVFIHGLTERGCSFAPIMYRLKDQFCCISVELANGKDDDAFIGSYTHESYVGDIHNLCLSMKLEKPMLFASSFGATIALGFLSSYPDLASAAVLQGAFARRPLAGPEKMLAKIAQIFPGRMRHMPNREKVMTLSAKPQFANAEAGMYEFCSENASDTPIRTAALRGLILGQLDLRPKLPAIQTPILMIGGDSQTVRTGITRRPA